ncbi:release factor glutamine methyltransferase [Ruminiclostridium sufflavum DSM 19573]|uniref:Release factor glutamine methyltransferase n=1 Tax=Ruminiclostridium sufflavum DSM 19573 TaxID=1121337 RepID=A0A318XIY4_9FIRM|nr:peptide chain release factor N(5)-glutamine methyltransferase [Ruminiclostridium sufflavum]PYG87190.1 release factor glutamine methyltransferase [Ruminiclostridium sufflavum DSM 19573]
MNIKEYFRFAAESLRKADIETPEFDAGVMLCCVLKCGRAYLYTHYDRVLVSLELEALDEMLRQRINNVPLQYIIGETEFMGLPFSVSPEVLIPRQDTESVIEEGIRLVKLFAEQAETNKSKEYANRAIRVLDMCTGSGCIAVSIAHYCPESVVVACDISQEALKIAEKNCRRNCVENRVGLRCGNLFNALDDGQLFDIIVSNPPYIETGVIPELQKEVKNYEPYLALDGGQDGLDFYRQIVVNAPAYLKNGGYLVLEIGYNQGQSVKNIMNQNFHDIEICKDISGNDRILTGRYIKP